MNKQLAERATAVINDDSEFNSLPIEERRRICKYLLHTEVQLLYQIIESDKSLTTEAWRTKKKKYLETLVSSYEKNYLVYEKTERRMKKEMQNGSGRLQNEILQ